MDRPAALRSAARRARRRRGTIRRGSRGTGSGRRRAPGRAQVDPEEDPVGPALERARACVCGCRPSSAIRAAMSTCQFGQRRRACARPAPRSSAAQPTWAPMNAVDGWRTTTASSPSISSSNGGKPGRSGRPAGRVGQKCQSGCSWSSSQRSLAASSGSKNAIGSATWIVTGTPSSPAAAHSGSSRGSSTATSRPPGSRARRPSGFQTLRPRAPAATRPAGARPRLAEGGVVRPAVVVEAREHGDAARQRACQRSISLPQPRRPSRRRGPRSRSTPAASSTAASSAAVRPLHSPPNGDAEVVVGIDRREPRHAARRCRHAGAPGRAGSRRAPAAPRPVSP